MYLLMSVGWLFVSVYLCVFVRFCCIFACFKIIITHTHTCTLITHTYFCFSFKIHIRPLKIPLFVILFACLYVCVCQCVCV